MHCNGDGPAKLLSFQPLPEVLRYLESVRESVAAEHVWLLWLHMTNARVRSGVLQHDGCSNRCWCPQRPDMVPTWTVRLLAVKRSAASATAHASTIAREPYAIAAETPKLAPATECREALATALDRAVRLNRRSVRQRRRIVVVTDAPPYPETEQATVHTARSFASRPGQTVSAVMVLHPRADPDRFMRSLAAAGNGSFIDARGGETMLASLLLAILKS